MRNSFFVKNFETDSNNIRNENRLDIKAIDKDPHQEMLKYEAKINFYFILLFFLKQFVLYSNLCKKYLRLIYK